MVVDPLVVIIDGNRKRSLGSILTDHVFVKRILDLGRRQATGCGRRLCPRALNRTRVEGGKVAANDTCGVIYAPVADINVGARHHRGNLIGGTATKRAANGVVSSPVAHIQ